MPPKNLRDEYGVTFDWPYRGDRSMVPHHLALEIAHREAAERKVSRDHPLHKFFIDRFSIFMNNLSIRQVHIGAKRRNRALAVK